VLAAMVEHGLDGEWVGVEACQCLRSGAGWKGQGRQRRSVEGKGRRGRVAQGARRKAKAKAKAKRTGERLGVGGLAGGQRRKSEQEQEQSKSKRAWDGAGLVVLTPEGGLAAGMGEGAAASREGPRWNRAHSGSGSGFWDSGFLGAASNGLTEPGPASKPVGVGRPQTDRPASAAARHDMTGPSAQE
jgi:hypothetical protein